MGRGKESLRSEFPDTLPEATREMLVGIRVIHIASKTALLCKDTLKGRIFLHMNSM